MKAHYLTAALLCTASLAATSLLPARADVLDNVMKSGVIRVGTDLGVPPAGMMSPDMKPTGADIDVGQALARDWKLKYQLIQTTGATRIPNLENDKADIRFTAAHAMTRDALEASIPRLRDMFSQQGLNLSQAQVFSQNSHDTHGRQPDANPSSSKPQNGDAAETQDAGPARPIAWRRGLVDDYA